MVKPHVSPSRYGRRVRQQSQTNTLPFISWFITPSKYSYLNLRIIHYGDYSYVHQLNANELGPHPVARP